MRCNDWGGAAYFLIVNNRLYAEMKLRLNDAMRGCCNQQKNATADSIMQTFNKLAKTEIFTAVLSEPVARQGFPNAQIALIWLKNTPPGFQTKQ